MPLKAWPGVVQKLQAYKKKLNASQRCYVDFDGRSRNPTLNIGGTFSGGEGDKINTVPAYARFFAGPPVSARRATCGPSSAS